MINLMIEELNEESKKFDQKEFKESVNSFLPAHHDESDLLIATRLALRSMKESLINWLESDMGLYFLYTTFVFVSLFKSELIMFDLDYEGYRIFVINQSTGFLDVMTFTLKLFWNLLVMSLIITFPVATLMMIAIYLDSLGWFNV